MSPVFLRAKSDGTHRLILNLSKLNEHLEKIHFKMETLKSVVTLVKKDCYFAKIDLKDAYYSVLVHQRGRKFLKFAWNSKLYQFTCLAQGLSPAPRVYTKLLKPVFSSLRKTGHTNSAYIDDVLLQSDSEAECHSNVEDTVSLLDSLGLMLHPEKSVTVPTQIIEFVGFLPLT